MSSEMEVVGRILGVHGVKGWVKVYSHTDPMDNLRHYQPWYLENGSQWESVDIAGFRRQGKGLVAKLAGIDDRDQAAETLVGRTIAVPTASLPRSGDGTYYWRDLIGLRVQLETGEDLGRVATLMETGANDVLVVRGDGNSLDRQERLIPWQLEEVIIQVDLEAGRLVVNWDPAF